MMKSRAKRIGTLQDLIDQERSLVLSCTTTGCPAADRPIDIAAIIAEHGNMTLQRFAERSTCSDCGARDPRTICAPIVVPMSEAWDQKQRGEKT